MNLDLAIYRRLEEFKTLGKCGEVTFDFTPFLDLKIRATLKTELAFCISTANSSAISGLKFQKLLELGYSAGEALRVAGVRFWKKKEKYVTEALKNFDLVEKALEKDSLAARFDLLKIKGIGMKEASHFLRNTGREDVAIIDRHILRWLERKGESVPKTLTPKRYLEVEETLKDMAKNGNLAEFDLRVWSQMTGKVLK